MKNDVCGTECTGYDGSQIWKKIHSIPKEISCERCSDHASLLFSGVHDTVNIGLKKPVHDPKAFEKFAKEIQCAYDKCVERGECGSHEPK
jgi:hypothetical protein